jgi:hypothetical protein
MTHTTAGDAGLDGWLYASECALPPAWAPRAVEDIVARSMPRNAALGVTGALLFTGARFVQFLEGPASSIATLRRSILADTRHHKVSTFLIGQRRDRMFRDWSLAYAGPSIFVADKVESLFQGGLRDTAEILALLEHFVMIQAKGS